MSEEDLRAVKSAYRDELKAKQAEARKKAAEENKKAGDAFLAENKTKEGVVTLPSGLQYKILKAGDGKKPTDADTVECHYRGTLLDGTEFDSSYGQGQPGDLQGHRGIIPGWTRGAEAHARGLQVAALRPPPARLRGAGEPAATSGRTRPSSSRWSSSRCCKPAWSRSPGATDSRGWPAGSAATSWS